MFNGATLSMRAFHRFLSLSFSFMVFLSFCLSLFLACAVLLFRGGVFLSFFNQFCKAFFSIHLMWWHCYYHWPLIIIIVINIGPSAWWDIYLKKTRALDCSVWWDTNQAIVKILELSKTAVFYGNLVSKYRKQYSPDKVLDGISILQ